MIGIRLGSFLFLGSPDSSFLFSYQAAAAPGYFARQIVFANDDLSPAIAAAKPTRDGYATPADCGLCFTQGNQFPETLTGDISSFLFLASAVSDGTPEKIVLINSDLSSTCTLADPVSGPRYP